MALVVISVDREALPEHTNEQFEEWIRYEVGETGEIKLNNPLRSYSLDAEVREI